jgi:Phage integrase, N-terminal SAM-like domain
MARRGLRVGHPRRTGRRMTFGRRLRLGDGRRWDGGAPVRALPVPGSGRRPASRRSGGGCHDRHYGPSGGPPGPQAQNGGHRAAGSAARADGSWSRTSTRSRRGRGEHHHRADRHPAESRPAAGGMSEEVGATPTTDRVRFARDNSQRRLDRRKREPPRGALGRRTPGVGSPAVRRMRAVETMRDRPETARIGLVTRDTAGSPASAFTSSAFRGRNEPGAMEGMLPALGPVHGTPSSGPRCPGGTVGLFYPRGGKPHARAPALEGAAVRGRRVRPGEDVRRPRDHASHQAPRRGSWTGSIGPCRLAITAAAPRTPSTGKRHPAEMGAAEITRFLTWLAVDGRVAASTQNQALSALLFLYREVPGVGPTLRAPQGVAFSAGRPKSR